MLVPARNPLRLAPVALVALAASALVACGTSPEIEDAHQAAGPTYEVVTVPASPVLVMTCPAGAPCVPPGVAPPAAPIVVAPPPPAPLPVIAPPTIVARPGLPPAAVQAVVHRGYAKMQRCYEKGLRRNPMLEGTVVARVRIDDDGEVDSAKDAGSTLYDRGVVKCVLKEIEDLEFPTSTRTTILLPIRFAPHA